MLAYHPGTTLETLMYHILNQEYIYNKNAVYKIVELT